MIHDPTLLDRLAGFKTQPYDGDVYRATRLTLEPLTPSTSGGRWAPKGHAGTPIPVLYTSLAKAGAIAEVASYWCLLTPRPSKPLIVHRLRVTTRATLRLLIADLKALELNVDTYHARNYTRSQEIGAAAAFLGFDGLQVPSARWDCENLVLFMDNHTQTEKLETVDSEEIDWYRWAQTHLADDKASSSPIK